MSRTLPESYCVLRDLLCLFLQINLCCSFAGFVCCLMKSGEKATITSGARINRVFRVGDRISVESVCLSLGAIIVNAAVLAA